MLQVTSLFSRHLSAVPQWGDAAHISEFQFYGEVILEEKFSAGLRTCCAPWQGGWKHFHLFLSSLCNLQQGKRVSLDLLRAQQSRHWRSWGNQALLWHLPPQPSSTALAVFLPWFQHTETFPLPNQSSLAVLSFFSHLHGAPQPHSPIPLLVGKHSQCWRCRWLWSCSLVAVSPGCSPPALGAHHPGQALGLLQLLWL